VTAAPDSQQSLPPAAPAPTAAGVRLLWSQALTGGARGLALAREKGWILAWDDANWLYLLNRQGQREAQVHAPGALASACCSDDGSAWAAVGSRGEVWWLAPDLTTRWQRLVPAPAVTAALDPFGQYLAVADARGDVHILDHLGRLVCRAHSPRPLLHLAFGPTALVGSADYGLVACLDLNGRWLWRDGLVAHVGSLAVSGDGRQVLLACFSEGVLRYDGQGRKQGRLAVPEPCRLVALSYDGRLLLFGGLSTRLLLLDAAGTTLASHQLEKPFTALALSPLGEAAVIALNGGPVVMLGLKRS
jgi:hypothetical protein